MGHHDLSRGDGQDSIDNEYLLLAVTEGLVGIGGFSGHRAGSAIRLMTDAFPAHWQTRTGWLMCCASVGADRAC